MRKLYISVITLITIVCVLVGVAIHFGDTNLGINIGSQEKQDVRALDIQLDSFSQIRVDADVMELTVEPGKDYTFSYNCTANMIPQFEVKDGILYITQEKNRINFGTNNCNAVLKVPEGTQLEMVEITSDVGDLFLDQLTIKELSVYSDVGEVTIDETTIGYARLELDVGDLDISRSRFEELEAYSDVGDVTIHSDVDLSAYSFDIVANVGDIEVNGRDYKDEYRSHNGQKLVKLSSDIGDVEINWSSDN